MITNKKGIELSFGWIFAIIVGAAVLFIAIYGASKLIDTSRAETDTKVAEQLGILLTPIETSLEDSKYVVIDFPDETRIFNRCREDGPFGRQIISASVRSGIGEEFQKESSENFFYNKYLFSASTEQGKELYVISKPFYFPYKTASLIFAYSHEYCFAAPPREIADEISSLGAAKITIANSSEECPVQSNIVCFSNSADNVDDACDINVNVASKTVSKQSGTVYYEGSLIYGAIFADVDVYECQVKRLMKRDAELAHLYADKADLLDNKGCSNSLGGDLRQYGALLANINSSASLKIAANEAETLGRRNENLVCTIF